MRVQLVKPMNISFPNRPRSSENHLVAILLYNEQFGVFHLLNNNMILGHSDLVPQCPNFNSSFALLKGLSKISF